MPKDIKKLLLKADKLQMGKELALAEEFIDIGEKMDENKDIIEKKLDTTIQGLNDLKEIKNVIENKDTEVIRTELLHVVTLKGDKGDDYILTNKDKKEIASMVKVPVVEKVVEKVTEVVNQPIESIIEKAVYESGIDIVNKINLLPIDEESQIDASHIKNLPETVRSVGFGSMIKEAPKDDKFYARKNRQWEEITNGGDSTWGSITGTLSNQTDLQNALNLKYDASNPAGYITSSALSGYTPTSRTITINGATQDLSSNRTWTISVPTKTSDLTNDSGFITSSALSGYLQNNVGIAGGTTLIGGTASGNNLTLVSTSNATKGKILFGTSAYDEVNNSLGIGTTSPGAKLDVNTGANGYVRFSSSGNSIGTGIRLTRSSTSDYAGLNLYTGSTIDWSFGQNAAGFGIYYQGAAATTRLMIQPDGKVGIGTTTPTALLMLAAGTATANTAPLKFTSGTNLATPEAGAIEYNNTFHVTNSDATRRHVVTAPNTTKVTASAPYTNDGYITINIGGTDFKVMTTA